MSHDDGTAIQPAAVDLETPTRRGDVIAAALCLIAGLGGYFVVVPFAVYVPQQFAGTANSPAFLPNVMFILLAALSALYLVQSIIIINVKRPKVGRPAPIGRWPAARR